MSNGPNNGSSGRTAPVSTRSYWICQLCGWVPYTLLKILGAVELDRLPWMSTTAALVLLGAAGMGLTHWLRAFMKRHGWNTMGAGRLVLRSVMASLILASPLALLTSFTPISWMQAPALQAEPAYVANFLLNLVNWAFVFLIWLAIYYTVVGIRQQQSAALRQSELVRALQQAELRLLKSQLNPHFLFNALNTVRSLIADDPSRAQHAVTHLANTLRYTLRAGQHELVTLSRELEIVGDFLALEKLRFEDRLTVAHEIDPDAGSARIPVMLLQTVVENAVKHGIAELPSGGTLEMSAILLDGTLVIEVKNPRPPASQPLQTHEGTGIRNSAERLRLLFDSQASIELDLSQPTTATTRIRIPQPQ